MPEQTLDQAALDELLETVGGDRGFLGELIETYLGDSPALFAQLIDGLASGDTIVVRRAAHTLKSTSATFGAARLTAMCRQIETAAGAGDLDGLAARTAAAQREFDDVAAALRVALAGDEAPGIQ
jgi:HPt (histidine-containing phosphotransfer) domain-containing protein